jgi:hypothetical protein
MLDLAWKPPLVILTREWAFCPSIVGEMPQGIHGRHASKTLRAPITRVSESYHEPVVMCVNSHRIGPECAI